MFCTACGADIPQGSRFCKRCGAAQREASTQESYSSDDRTAHPPTAPPETGERSGRNPFVLIGLVVVPLVVICALVTMVGAMRPSEKKAPEFTSPRMITFSGTGPESAKLGAPAEFNYEVANVGTADFKDFRIAFPETIDKAFDISGAGSDVRVVGEGGKKMLSFGLLTSGQKRSFTITLVPKVEGEQEVKATFYDGSSALSNERSEGMVYKKIKIER